MEFQVNLLNFRGFQEQNNVKIRPITLLVGENSAGKSSFLAGYKYILDFIGGLNDPTFNGDPFQLGTYDQIAHYRGGRGGRAREFRVGLSQYLKLSKGRFPKKTGPTLVKFELTFRNYESHAVVSTINITANNERLEITLSKMEFAPRYLLKMTRRFS